MMWPSAGVASVVALAGMVLVGDVRKVDGTTEESAHALYCNENWAGAANAYELLTKIQPAKGLNWYRLGACRLHLKEYEPALSAFETALMRGAPVPQTRYNMACAYARIGAKEAALTCLEVSAAGGFAKARIMKQEADLATLRGEQRWVALIAKLENPTKGLKGADAFDHWIGEWDVYVNGQLVGKNRIIKSLDGYAVEEFWESRNGSSGRSFFVFEVPKGTWKQLWTSDTGWIVEKTGKPIKDGIYLEGTSTFANGATKKSREHLTKSADGSVRQLMEDWDEQSKEWKVSFDGRYLKKTSAKQ